MPANRTEYTHDDKSELLTQTRARTTNPDQFYKEIIKALSHLVTLEQFDTICNAALDATAESRSLHED
jgi:hypothetical protein